MICPKCGYPSELVIQQVMTVRTPWTQRFDSDNKYTYSGDFLDLYQCINCHKVFTDLVKMKFEFEFHNDKLVMTNEEQIE